MLTNGRHERINKRKKTGDRRRQATSLFFPSLVCMQMTSQSVHMRVKVIDSFTPVVRSKPKDFIIKRTWIHLHLQETRCC